MKLWKALVILFCVLVGSGVSHAGFLSTDPGLSPGQTLPPGLIIPNPIISNPQLSGLITLVPGSTLWVQGNVQYEPYAIIAGPDGSIWDHNGLNGLASLTMSGVLTFADGSYWDSGGLDTTTHTVLNINGTTNFGPNTIINYSTSSLINGPDGSVWDNRGIRNLNSLSVVNNVTIGGALNVTGNTTLNNLTLNGTLTTTQPATFSTLTVTNTLTGPSGSWTSTGLNLTQLLSFNGTPMGGVCTGGMFVNALSSTGVLTCATPTGGSGTVTSVGLSGGTTGLTVAGSPITTSGTMTLGGTLAIASGGTGAATAPAALTNLGAAPIASPTFTGTVTIPAGASIAGFAPLASPVFTGTPSLPTGTIGITQTAGTNNTTLATTAFVAAAVSAGTAGVSSWNTRTGAVVLTLADVTGVGGAPAASPTFTGTVTMPGAGTFTAAGYNNSAGIGVGQAAIAGGIGVTGTGNVNTTAFSAINTNAGNNAQASGGFQNNLSHYGTFGLTGSGYNQTSTIPGDSLYFYTNGVNGMEFFNANATAEPIRFYVTSSTLAGGFGIGGGTGGFVVGAATGGTGGDMGLGTVNVSGGFYVNGAAVGGGGGGTVTSVGLSGGTTGLTVSGSPVTTSGTMTLAGTLAVANGGTGATTAGAALTSLGAAPTASPTFTGTVSFPDGSTYSAAGHNSMKALGIGAAAGTVGSLMVPITTTTNQGLFFGPQTGTSSGGMIQSTGAQILAFGIGAHSDGTNWVADQTTAAFAYMSVTRGVSFWHASGLTVGNTFVPTVTGQFILGLQVGSPTGGDMGVGTVNATGYYVNGVALSGGGAFLPLAGGQMTGNIGFSNGGRITGNMSGTPRANRFAFQDDGTSGGGLTNLGIIPPTGGSNSSYFTVWGNTDVDNAPFIQAGVTTGSSAGFTSNATGTGTVLPFSFTVGSTAIMTVSTSGLNLTAGNFQVSGANFGGTCTGGQFVSAISAAVIPTCTTPAAGSFAPLTNPGGGQNNYAPLASPTFTGTVTLPGSSTVTSGLGGFIIKNDPNYPSIFFNGTATQPNGAIQMQGASTMMLAEGMHVNSSGTFIADNTSPAALVISSTIFQYDSPTSATVGSAVTHNYLMQWFNTTHSLAFNSIIAGTAGTGGGTAGGAACFNSAAALISNAANCIASSLTLKTDIRPLDGALATIEKLAPAAIYYRYKQGTDHSEQPGFGAETVAQIDPRYATYQNGKPAGVRYEQMAATEAAAIAEQQKEIEELKAEVKQLRGW